MYFLSTCTIYYTQPKITYCPLPETYILQKNLLTFIYFFTLPKFCNILIHPDNSPFYPANITVYHLCLSVQPSYPLSIGVYH